MRLVVPPELWPFEQALERWAEQEPSIGRIWLYGSRLTARARPDSDIDVAIALLAPCGDAAYAQALRRFRRRVQKMTKLRVDLRIADATRDPEVCGYVEGASALVFRRVRRVAD
jgi:predicted nucleotidyltransferase